MSLTGSTVLGGSFYIDLVRMGKLIERENFYIFGGFMIRYGIVGVGYFGAALQGPLQG